MTASAPLLARLDRLRRDRPDWAAYIAVLREAAHALAETAEPSMRGRQRIGSVTVALAPNEAAAPVSLLAGAVFHVDPHALDRWLRRLLRVAAEHGAAAALGEAPRSRTLDALALLEAAINQDAERLATLAGGVGADAAAIGAVVHAAAAPLLHQARASHEGGTPSYWEHGYCPVCAAFPTLAEARGLERARRLRCARCGGDWWTEWLRCSFCANRDHTTLGSLVLDGTGETRRVETCDLCHAYVKLVTTLTALPAADLALEDLLTVDLDVAALERGYRRPDTPGARLGVRIVSTEGAARPRSRFGAIFSRS